jgi:hypothetical protein
VACAGVSECAARLAGTRVPKLAAVSSAKNSVFIKPVLIAVSRNARVGTIR